MTLTEGIHDCKDCPTAQERDRVCRAIGHYAGHAPLDFKKPREIQADLFAIVGSPHVHVASIGSDECDLCGRDLRHEVHKNGSGI
jgi:hypothetical protein